MRYLFIALCLLLCAPFAAVQGGDKKTQAQIKPDFSGSWVLKKVNTDDDSSYSPDSSPPDLSKNAPPNKVTYKDKMPYPPPGATPEPSSKPNAVLTIMVVHRDPEFKITRKVNAKDHQSAEEEIFYSDGRGESNLDNGYQRKSNTMWDGKKLVAKSTSSLTLPFKLGDKPAKNVWNTSDSWELSEDNNTLTEIRMTKDAEGRQISRVKLVFKRLP